jgi:hypothetical protein
MGRKFHFLIHKSPPLVPLMNQINPAHALHKTPWRCILILPSNPFLSLRCRLFSSGFPTQILYAPLLSHVCAKCRSYLILLGLTIGIIFGEKYTSCRARFSPVPLYLVSFTLKASYLRTPSACVLHLPQSGRTSFTPKWKKRRYYISKHFGMYFFYLYHVWCLHCNNRTILMSHKCISRPL